VTALIFVVIASVSVATPLIYFLLGGATALLPIYARDILQTGPWGLGILRAAPAVGALVMTAVLARHTINRRVGVRMFQAVIVFGVATVVFAVSQWMWLSVVALAILGAADIVSVVIRFSLVQLATPDDMRGRVGAVNFLQRAVSGGQGDLAADYSSLLALADDAVALIAEINLVLAANHLSASTAATISSAVTTMASGTDPNRLKRIYASLTLALASPDFVVLK